MSEVRHSPDSSPQNNKTLPQHDSARTRASQSPWKHKLTQRHNQEAHVVEPVGRLVGELSDEELQDGSQVTLAAHRRHFHRSGHGRVTVTATGTERERERERERCHQCCVEVALHRLIHQNL